MVIAGWPIFASTQAFFYGLADILLLLEEIHWTTKPTACFPTARQ